MFGAILKATHSSFQKGMTFCRSIYVKIVMKLLSFIFEQPSYFYLTHSCMYQPVGKIKTPEKPQAARWPHVNLKRHCNVSISSPYRYSAFSGYSGSLFFF